MLANFDAVRQSTPRAIALLAPFDVEQLEYGPARTAEFSSRALDARRVIRPALRAARVDPIASLKEV